MKRSEEMKESIYYKSIGRVMQSDAGRSVFLRDISLSLAMIADSLMEKHEEEEKRRKELEQELERYINTIELFREGEGDI